MLRTLRAHFLSRILPVLSATLVYGCSDASTPLEPRIDPRMHALVAPEVVVTNTDDAGPGSLRQTIADAADGSVIHFDAAIAGGAIVLSTGYLQVDKHLTIEGSQASGMIISGGLTSLVFEIPATGDLTVRNVSVVDGRGQEGGGLHVSGKATLDHALVANNEAIQGGGGVYVEPGGGLLMFNSTISDNHAFTVGGGITSGGNVAIRNSTITGNVAGSAGGLWLFNGSFSLRNSIVANNADNDASNAVDSDCLIKDLPTFYEGHNLTTEGTCGTGPSVTVADPELGPLASNGGPTRTHALLRASPAIDAGTSCTEATDQRYVARTQGTSCDIGAFEFTDYATVTVTIGPDIAVNAKTGVATVTGTMKCSSPVGPILTVSLSQTQKTKGKFSTIVQASTIPTGIVCSTANTPYSWSFTLTPQSGKFEPGAATGTANVRVPNGFIAPAVTTPLKLFQVK